MGQFVFRHLLVAVFMLACAAAASAKDKDPLNIDVAIGWGGCFRAGEWTPIHINIVGDFTKPFGGVATVRAPQDEMTSTTIAQDFVLTPELPLQLPLISKVAASTHELEVTIRGQEDNRVWWQQQFSMSDYSGTANVRLLSTSDVLIGLVGKKGFSLGRLSDFCTSKAPHSPMGPGKVYLREKLPTHLPWDWTGYASLDLLLLYDVDWDQISAGQSNAIIRWVSNGGKVLFVLGSHPLSPKHPLAQLLPYQIGQPKTARLDKAAWGEINSEITCWPLTAKACNDTWKEDDMAAGETVFASGCVGFGKVGVLAFDPEGMGKCKAEEATHFWALQLQNLLGTPDSAKADSRTIAWSDNKTGNNENPYAYNYNASKQQMQLNEILEELLRIKQMEPISINWVLGILAGLGLLLGPVDYLVLKKIDRLPLTWLTSSAYIVIFTVGAYFLVDYLRAGEMQVRGVSIVDGIAGSDCAWRSDYIGIFAPKNEDYKLTKLQAQQWWSTVSPMRETEYIGYRGSSSLASRNITCYQADGSNLPVSLPINIWSMQCLMCESPQQKMPISASLVLDSETATFTLNNESDSPLHFGEVIFNQGHSRMNVPNIPPHSSQTLSLPLQSIKNSSRGSTYTNNYHQALGTDQRNQAIAEYLASGAAIVTVELSASDSHFVEVKDRSGTFTRREIVRAVIFPQIKSSSSAKAAGAEENQKDSEHD